jgi:hypothetical protein
MLTIVETRSTTSRTTRHRQMRPIEMVSDSRRVAHPCGGREGQSAMRCAGSGADTAGAFHLRRRYLRGTSVTATVFSLRKNSTVTQPRSRYMASTIASSSPFFRPSPASTCETAISSAGISVSRMALSNSSMATMTMRRRSAAGWYDSAKKSTITKLRLHQQDGAFTFFLSEVVGWHRPCLPVDRVWYVRKRRRELRRNRRRDR